MELLRESDIGSTVSLLMVGGTQLSGVVQYVDAKNISDPIARLRGAATGIHVEMVWTFPLAAVVAVGRMAPLAKAGDDGGP